MTTCQCDRLWEPVRQRFESETLACAGFLAPPGDCQALGGRTAAGLTARPADGWPNNFIFPMFLLPAMEMSDVGAGDEGGSLGSPKAFRDRDY